jgi:probable F420-dependent oxidoreductase
MSELRAAWQAADELGVDTIWTWDHFYPLYGPSDGAHFEGWSLLAAMALDTSRASVGMLVTGNSYRNPDLVADMARTVDHLSGGRVILGMGAGWFERDYREYGYDFGDAPGRLQSLERSLERIKARLPRLNPPPLGPLPIMVGGAGEKVTLRLVAQHADMWNTFGPAESYAHKSQVLDRWCERVGRDPAAVERTCLLNRGSEVSQLDELVGAGAQHLILGLGHPFDLDPVQRLIEAARA